MKNTEEKFNSIRTGLLEFVLLSLIEGESMYVADILRKLEGTEFKTQEGTLYPLLSRLRREEILEYEWQESDAGPPRKYYRLTAKGEEELRKLKTYWHSINNTIHNL